MCRTSYYNSSLFLVYFHLFSGITLHKEFCNRGENMYCPNCRSKEIGKIGVNQFYCWDCFIELSIVGGLLHMHQVEEDGTLSSLDDSFSEEERKEAL